MLFLDLVFLDSTPFEAKIVSASATMLGLFLHSPYTHDTPSAHNVHSPKVGRHPPPQPQRTNNGTLRWHHVHSPKVGRHPAPQP